MGRRGCLRRVGARAAARAGPNGDGSELQSALEEWTRQRTVPNVFINGKHIGGCDATVALNNGGKLVALLTEAGAIASSAAETTTTA